MQGQERLLRIGLGPTGQGASIVDLSEALILLLVTGSAVKPTARFATEAGH